MGWIGRRWPSGLKIINSCALATFVINIHSFLLKDAFYYDWQKGKLIVSFLFPTKLIKLTAGLRLLPRGIIAKSKGVLQNAV